MSNIFLTSGEEEESVTQDATPYMNISEMKKVYQSGEEMTVYFEVYNLSLNLETGLCDFTTEYQFFHKGKLLAKVPAPMQILKDQKEYQVNTSFKLKNFKPGEYTLRVKAADLNAGKTESKETTFIVTD